MSDIEQPKQVAAYYQAAMFRNLGVPGSLIQPTGRQERYPLDVFTDRHPNMAATLGLAMWVPLLILGWWLLWGS